MANTDGEFTPVTFTKQVGDEKQTRTAYTPADHVRFVYEGWTEQKASGSGHSASGTAGTAKAAGSK